MTLITCLPVDLAHPRCWCWPHYFMATETAAQESLSVCVCVCEKEKSRFNTFLPPVGHDKQKPNSCQTRFATVLKICIKKVQHSAFCFIKKRRKKNDIPLWHQTGWWLRTDTSSRLVRTNCSGLTSTSNSRPLRVETPAALLLWMDGRMDGRKDGLMYRCFVKGVCIFLEHWE